MSLNAVKHDGNHLTIEETEVVLSKFKEQFKYRYPHAGFQLVLEASPNGRPHWHGIFLGCSEHEIGEAWHRACKLACKDYEAWCQVGEIKTTLNQAINYMFKIWGENRDGSKVLLPVKGVKPIVMFNFFKNASKQAIEQDLKALKPKFVERLITKWKPDDIEDELERWVERYRIA